MSETAVAIGFFVLTGAGAALLIWALMAPVKGGGGHKAATQDGASPPPKPEPETEQQPVHPGFDEEGENIGVTRDFRRFIRKFHEMDPISAGNKRPVWSKINKPCKISCTEYGEHCRKTFTMSGTLLTVAGKKRFACCIRFLPYGAATPVWLSLNWLNRIVITEENLVFTCEGATGGYEALDFRRYIAEQTGKKPAVLDYEFEEEFVDEAVSAHMRTLPDGLSCEEEDKIEQEFRERWIAENRSRFVIVSEEDLEPDDADYGA